MAELSVEISAKIDKLLSELKKAKGALGGIGVAAEKLVDKLKNVGEKMSKIGKSMTTYLTLPLAAIAGASIKMASDFTESLNKVDVAFKNSSKEVRKFAETTLETFGIAEGTALDMSALFGDMATSMGVPTDKAATLATEMVGLAGDMSSFKNIGIKEVTTALNGVFTGETESLKRMGIVMTIANLKTFALTQGMNDNIEAMTQAQKVQLRYAYILSVTKNAQGDFARTSDGSANQMRIFTESVKELSVAFGEILLPYFTKAITYVNGVVKAFTNLSPTTKKIIVVVAALVAVMGPLLIGLGFLSTTIIPALITGFTVLLGPIGLITAAVVALGILVYKNFDAIIVKIAEFYNSFVDVYNQSTLLRGVIAGIGLAFKNVFIVAKMSFKNIWAYIKGIGSNINSLFLSIGKVISGALLLDPKKIKDGLKGVKDVVGNAFTEISGEVKKNTKEAAEQISKNFTEALDTTLNGHLEKKTPLQIKESLTSLGDSLKETAKAVGVTIGSSLSDGVDEGSAGGRRKATGLNIPEAGVSGDMGQESTLNSIVPKIDTTLFDENASLMMTKLQEFNESANNLIQGSISQTFSNLGSSIGEALATGGNVLTAVGNTIIQGLSSFLSEMGGMLVKYGTLAILKGKLDLAILAGGPVAIGAGIAAVAVGIALSAAGAAIGSLSSNGSSSGGGSRRGQTGSSNFSGSSGGGNFGASSGGGMQNVVFEIQGTKLVGVLSNTLSRNRSLGGSLSI
tara:strand:+ start:2975 stop:5197 length:2223 start_codon:yes stop_codon:yes gene_type:complete